MMRDCQIDVVDEFNAIIGTTDNALFVCLLIINPYQIAVVTERKL